MSIANLPQLNPTRAGTVRVAMDLEAVAHNAKVMVTLTRECLNNVGPGQNSADLLADIGEALSLIDATTMYVGMIESINAKIDIRAAMDLETVTSHLKVMVCLARDRLDNVGPGQQKDDMLNDVGDALSLLDAAALYLAKIESINTDLYAMQAAARV